MTRSGHRWDSPCLVCKTVQSPDTMKYSWNELNWKTYFEIVWNSWSFCWIRVDLLYSFDKKRWRCSQHHSCQSMSGSPEKDFLKLLKRHVRTDGWQSTELQLSRTQRILTSLDDIVAPTQALYIPLFSNYFWHSFHCTAKNTGTYLFSLNPNFWGTPQKLQLVWNLCKRCCKFSGHSVQVAATFVEIPQELQILRNSTNVASKFPELLQLFRTVRKSCCNFCGILQ